MNKSQISIAVCGAIGAVGASVAQAQNATVNVYGRLYAEYVHYEHANRSATEEYQNFDHLGNPGSRLGFRGQEKLGGGMSVWFQCETTMDWRGANNAPSNATGRACRACR